MRCRAKFPMLFLLVSLLLLVAPTAVAQSNGHDKIVFNEAYTLRAGEILSGNLAVFGGSVTLEPDSTVGGDVVLFGGRLVVEGAITGDVAAFGGRVVLGDSAVLAGDFTALGGSIDRSPGAKIQGETLIGLRSLGFAGSGLRFPEMTAPPPLKATTQLLERFFHWQLRTFGTALLLAILGVVALLVAPANIGRVSNAAAAQPAVSFGMGLLTFLLALFAGALLLIACGLGLLVWLALLIGLLLGWIGAGLWIGQRLLAALRVRTASSVSEAFVGIFLITVLAELPYCIGFFVWLILGLIGLGAVALTRFGVQSAESAAPAQGAAVLPVDAKSLESSASTSTAGDDPQVDSPPEDALPS